jgi:uncharacterized protein YbjT (DUF2867 family)
MKTLLLLGSTGLVGKQVLRLALAHPEVAQVVAPVRTDVPLLPRVAFPKVDFEGLPPGAPWWRADAVVCMLGTTMRLAGSQAAFRRVDHDYVVMAARLAKQAGTPVFVLNSSLGAGVDASSFYLRVKGETERDLAALEFTSLTCVRPSLLDGGPRPDRRPGESAALALSRWFRPLIPRRYRPVRTEAVAAMLLAAALSGLPGEHIVEPGLD